MQNWTNGRRRVQAAVESAVKAEAGLTGILYQFDREYNSVGKAREVERASRSPFACIDESSGRGAAGSRPSAAKFIDRALKPLPAGLRDTPAGEGRRHQGRGQAAAILVNGAGGR